MFAEHHHFDNSLIKHVRSLPLTNVTQRIQLLLFTAAVMGCMYIVVQCLLFLLYLQYVHFDMHIEMLFKNVYFSGHCVHGTAICWCRYHF